MNFIVTVLSMKAKSTSLIYDLRNDKMKENLLDTLNSIYEPMCKKCAEIKKKIESAGFFASHGFYNNHYVKVKNDFVVEHFPIPVIFISNIGDIGIDIDSIWFELKISKDKALKLDYEDLINSYNINIYGADDFLNDFYHEKDDFALVKEKIRNSNETSICITFYFEKDTEIDKLVNVVEKFI